MTAHDVSPPQVLAAVEAMKQAAAFGPGLGGGKTAEEEARMVEEVRQDVAVGAEGSDGMGGDRGAEGAAGRGDKAAEEYVGMVEDVGGGWGLGPSRGRRKRCADGGSDMSVCVSCVPHLAPPLALRRPFRCPLSSTRGRCRCTS